MRSTSRSLTPKPGPGTPAAAGADVLVAHPGLAGTDRVDDVVAAAPKGSIVLVHEPARAKGAHGVFRT